MICPELGPQAILYVAQKLKMTPQSLEPCIGVAILVDSRIEGGLVFRNYKGHDMEIAMAFDTPRAFTKGVIKFTFSYIFGQHDCARCTALIKRSNKRSRRLVEGLGFVLEGKARQGYDGIEDLMIYGMLKQECRWFK